MTGYGTHTTSSRCGRRDGQHVTLTGPLWLTTAASVATSSGPDRDDVEAVARYVATTPVDQWGELVASRAHMCAATGLPLARVHAAVCDLIAAGLVEVTGTHGDRLWLRRITPRPPRRRT